MKSLLELCAVGCLCLASAAFLGARPSRAGADQCETDADCADRDACTTDACVLGNCVNTPLDCDDGDACTDDFCNGSGECVHKPAVCNDRNDCTLDTCDAEIGCVYELLDCNDDDDCTTDSCDADGNCVHAAVPDCDEDSGGGQGCTPGYWKQKHHFDSWTGYEPTESFGEVFDVPANLTLRAALRRGGGQEKALGRHAVAALLNAAHPDVDYGLGAGEIIDLVQEAFDTEDYESAKDLLAEHNELGCPLR